MPRNCFPTNSSGPAAQVAQITKRRHGAHRTLPPRSRITSRIIVAKVSGIKEGIFFVKLSGICYHAPYGPGSGVAHA